MTRVATIPIQRNLSSAIMRSQQKLAETQLQLATTKKARDYAALGTETVRHISARTLLAKQEAQSDVLTTLGTTLTLYDANMSGIETAASELRQSLLEAIGTNSSGGLQEAIEQAFSAYRNGLNASEGGQPLFAGSRTDAPPFKADTLADTLALTTATAFTDDTIRPTARVAEGFDVQYGAGASEIGTGLFIAFQKLATAGSIGLVPTDAQMTVLKDAVGLIETGLDELRDVNAENGRKQKQIESIAVRGEERTLLLKDVIGRNEDANLAEVANDLAQQQTTLRASYSVFSQLSALSLTEYLR
ncbi:flagellin [Sphingomonas parva]|uniref:Flagellin n=1 Tax=Sphingomonas parva TaxID=2555898 RepID=A0A4Y8ZM69_9SPHN|nr:flagellin [Sphingomonas parva]TFI57103.1 flagellin [Sphingomonas parva]